MTDTRIAPDLLTAYRQAEYVVETAAGEIILKVGKPSSRLETLHSQYDVCCSAVITACNPFGEPAAAESNLKANLDLQQDLYTAGCSVLPCTGRDPEGHWPEEAGFLAMGLDYERARQLGIHYKQNAILYSDRQAIPGLVLLR